MYVYIFLQSKRGLVLWVLTLYVLHAVCNCMYRKRGLNRTTDVSVPSICPGLDPESLASGAATMRRLHLIYRAR